MTDYLKDFFAEDATRKAAVPGLGVFYAEAGTAGRYRILFEEVAPKGKDFINHVAFRMNVTEQEAVEKLDEWVKDILKSLKSIKVATLPGIGTFEVSDGRVNFLPSAEQDKEDHFGLEPMEGSMRDAAIDEMPLEAETDDLEDDALLEDEVDSSEEGGEYHKDLRKKRQTMLMWVGIGGCIVILLVVLLLVFKPFSGVSGRDSAVIEDIILGQPACEAPVAPVTEPAPAVSEKSREDAAIEQAFMAGEREKKAAEAQARREQAVKPAPKPAQAAKPVAKPAPKPAQAAKPTPKPAQTAKSAAQSDGLAKGVSRAELGKFYIIVGSYANLDNARGVYDQLSGNGAFDVKILFDAQKNIYRVSIKEFFGKGDAIRFKNELWSGAGMDGWIYEHK